jgi:hypothetical protein
MSAARLFVAAVFALLVAGCATTPHPEQEPVSAPQPAPGAVLESLKLGTALEDRILALDPEHVSEADVRDTLAKAPAPRIFSVHGGVYPVELLMVSFARFLTGMGYPENRIRDAGDSSFSHSPYASGAQQAGEIAWYYEHEGLRPMLIGHSQGGIQVVKILHELAGSFSPTLNVYDPLTGQFQDRTTIVDPLTGQQRPVVGVSVSYASVVGTGGWALALPVHWMVLSRVRTIPDTVDDFTGFRIGVDFFAWDVPGMEDLKTFHANGKAIVRNVTLPAEYSHVFVPATADLAKNPAMKSWIDAYDPNDASHRAPVPDANAQNVLWAADVWYSVKKHWCLELQRLIRARRAAIAAIAAIAAVEPAPPAIARLSRTPREGGIARGGIGWTVLSRTFARGRCRIG